MRLRRSDCSAPGFVRVRAGRGFSYRDAEGRTVTDPELRSRFASLVIPPAWTDVWISPHVNGHIQATGIDAAGRRQYLYHPQWRSRMDDLKFDRALALARALPAARRAATRDLHVEGLPRERVLAAAFRLLDRGGLRIGSEEYAQANGSVGLSTLRCSHANVEGDVVRLRFPGKSGQRWVSELQDADLAQVIGELRVRGGRARLLSFWEDEAWHPVTASHVNAYVRDRAGEDFTAKDFRTLRGTVAAALSLARAGPKRTQSARARAVAAAMREVASELGNTPAIARSSYVDPRVLDHYDAGRTIDASRVASAESQLVELLAR